SLPAVPLAQKKMPSNAVMSTQLKLKPIPAPNPPLAGDFVPVPLKCPALPVPSAPGASAASLLKVIVSANEYQPSAIGSLSKSSTKASFTPRTRVLPSQTLGALLAPAPPSEV